MDPLTSANRRGVTESSRASTQTAENRPLETFVSPREIGIQGLRNKAGLSARTAPRSHGVFPPSTDGFHLFRAQLPSKHPAIRSHRTAGGHLDQAQRWLRARAARHQTRRTRAGWRAPQGSDLRNNIQKTEGRRQMHTWKIYI